jgi:hypothetical protein
MASKLSGLLEDRKRMQKNTPVTVEEEAKPSSVHSNRFHMLLNPSRKVYNRVLSTVSHVILAAAAALAVPYGLWLAAKSDPNGFGRGSVAMTLQPLLQVSLLQLASRVSWALAGREEWAGAKQLHAAVNIRCVAGCCCSSAC